MKISSLLVTALAAVALQACSDTTAELATPGGSAGTGTLPPPASPPPPPPPPASPPPPVSSCPTGTTEVSVAGQTHCRLAGTITGNVTLTSGRIYQLSGAVRVGSDIGGGTSGSGLVAGGASATLTVQPGVTVYAASLDSLLIVTRGSRLIADGTQSSPIIFTSAQDAGFSSALGLTNSRAPFTGPSTQDPNSREWGGLVINGRAPVNFCASGRSPTSTSAPCETDGEGGSGLYGGAFPNDNSGVLRYVQVRYAGNPISQTNELNGIAFQGVGNGTLIDFLQVHNAADDGVEMFGGTVDMRHLVVTGADDDSIDWVGGWTGRVQFALVVQNPLQTQTDQGIEADDQAADNPVFNDVNALPRSAPVLSNVTLIGTQSVGTGQRNGVLLRRGTAGQLANFVVTGFVGSGLDVDDQATYDQITASALNVRSMFNANTPALRNDASGPADNPLLPNFFNGAGRNNVISQPSLSGFINGQLENAAAAVDPTTLGSFFQSAQYVGAIRSPADNWTLGWTFGVNPPSTCPAGTLSEPGSGGVTNCVLTGTVTGSVRLVNAPNLTYSLRGPVRVGRDLGGVPNAPLSTGTAAILTVDAGVTVRAESLDSLLIVTRGSQLRANGTRTAPVVFTANIPSGQTSTTATRLWGGLVINGRAPVNFCASGRSPANDPANTVPCETDGEGGSGTYGGNNTADSSGNLLFTRVEYAGNPISQTNELNGVAFQGVGNGTVVDYLQVHNAADDGVEMFGGSVDMRHIVITGADDDSIDWVGGWTGRVQYGVVVQNVSQTQTDQGIEADTQAADNPVFNDVNALPRSAPVLSNITLVGVTSVGTGQRNGILLRRGTAGRVLNSVVTGFVGSGLDVDDQATYDQITAGTLDVRSLFNANTPALRNDASGPADTPLLPDFFNGSGRNNATGTSTLRVQNTGGLRAYINGANENGATVSAVGSDPFFQTPTFVGAVPSPTDNFTTGWTIWLND